VLVDEAQFLSEAQVQEMADMAMDLEIYCYGLRTDFMGNFFPGSAALLRLAEDIAEVPGGLCWCGRKATMNTRIDPAGRVIKEGEQVLIDSQLKDIRYIGLCYEHWRKGISSANG
jgi:thymidine kinase